ncbi:MAG TPA: response regulator, partial [Allosphingosinicella sp.]|nr:response regulator [Allosphingosinicella sp.]
MEEALNSHFVYVVDDDRDVRRSLSFMLGASEIRSHPFGSGEDFLDAVPDLQPGCVLLDLQMPQMDGFHVMAELSRREIDWPVIVMTGHGEVPVAVRAMKLGAVDFIEKPFSEQALLTCFGNAFSLLTAREETGRRRREARERVRHLTGRESEILLGLLAGESNKQLAS